MASRHPRPVRAAARPAILRPSGAALAARELERCVDLLLLAWMAATTLFLIVGMIWLVPMAVIAALASTGDVA